MSPRPVPVGPDAPIMAVMTAMRAMRRPWGSLGLVRRRPTAEVIHRDRW